MIESDEQIKKGYDEGIKAIGCLIIGIIVIISLIELGSWIVNLIRHT